MSKVFFRLRSDRGQVLIEYILLLVIVVSCASVMIKGFVSRSPGSEGMVIKAWNSILKVIGNDIPDCPKQVSFTNPNCPP